MLQFSYILALNPSTFIPFFFSLNFNMFSQRQQNESYSVCHLHASIDTFCHYDVSQEAWKLCLQKQYAFSSCSRRRHRWCSERFNVVTIAIFAIKPYGQPCCFEVPGMLGSCPLLEWSVTYGKIFKFSRNTRSGTKQMPKNKKILSLKYITLFYDKIII